MISKNDVSIEIINTSEADMIIIHEPECFEFLLKPNEELMIEFDSNQNAISLRHSIEDGKIIIGILSNNSLYKVLYNEVDIFRKFY